MTVELSEVEFTSGFFYVTLPDGGTLVLNSVDEDFIDSSGNETAINQVNVGFIPYGEESLVRCSSVIGIGNEYFTLGTDYNEYVGKILDNSNIKYCKIEVEE